MPVQRLAVGAVNDPLELEAEQVADSVVAVLRRRHQGEGSPAADPHSCDSGCQHGDVLGALRRRAEHGGPIGAAGGELSAEVEQRLRTASTGGSPLPSALRSDLESTLGADLSRVRLHTGPASAQLNRSISAVAFTHGQDVHFRDGMPDTSTDTGMHLLAHELTHTVQQGAAPLARQAGADVPEITRFATVTIRRAPIPTFSSLKPRKPGEKIPVFDKRPSWLRGGHGEAETVRAEVAATVRSMVQKSPIEFDPDETVYQCQLCGRWSILDALSVDHIVDWKEFCAPATDYQQFEQLYHEVGNLHLVHNNCNSSKKATELFEWWLGQTGAGKVPKPTADRIIAALGRMFEMYGVEWVEGIPIGQRTNVISGIVRQSSANAFEHLMGNAQILNSLGWSEAGPAPSTDVEMEDDSDQ